VEVEFRSEAIESAGIQLAGIPREAVLVWAALRVAEIPPAEPRQGVPLEAGQREGIPAADHLEPALASAAEMTEDATVQAELRTMKSCP
jgi:hypothetical protein